MHSSARWGAVDSRLQLTRVIVGGRAIALALSLAACISRRPQPIAPLQSLARDSLLLSDARRADINRTSAVGSASFSPDAVYLRAGAPIVVGRENVAAMLRATVP